MPLLAILFVAFGISLSSFHSFVVLAFCVGFYELLAEEILWHLYSDCDLFISVKKNCLLIYLFYLFSFQVWITCKVICLVLTFWVWLHQKNYFLTRIYGFTFCVFFRLTHFFSFFSLPSSCILSTPVPSRPLQQGNHAPKKALQRIRR